MRKLMVVLMMVVALGGVAFADWSADYAAWSKGPVSTRFFSPAREVVFSLLKTAAPVDVALIVKDTEAVVYDEKADAGIRGYAADVLGAAFISQVNVAIAAKNKDAALDAWAGLGKLSDAHRVAPLNMWGASGVQWRSQTGGLLVKAGYLSQADLDADIASRFADLKMEDRIVIAEMMSLQKPTLPEVLAYVKVNGGNVGTFPRSQTFLADSYAKGELSAKDYATALKGVIIASVDRMNNMAKDDPSRSTLLDAISQVKTSLKQLQEIEGNL